MRGKESTAHDYKKIGRITPAYAGKRPHRTVQKGSLWDHPRLCGEKDTPSWRNTSILGSPPPMRGKDNYVTYDGVQAGITPAYAGKSYGPAHSWAGGAGSPPPMRGKVSAGCLPSK